MAATDTLDNLDRLLQSTRQQHVDEMKGVNDQLLASQLELSLTKDALATQQERTAVAERFSVKLITQFAMVDAALTLANKAFSDARSAALSATVSTDDIGKKSATPAEIKKSATSAEILSTRVAVISNGDDGTPHYTPPPQGYQPPPGVPQGQGIDPDAPHG